jgi:CRP/FNR family transcriptional regulator, anaerobic regulatory protein
MAAAYFDNKSSSNGVAVEPTDAFVFPSHLVMEWQLKYPSWNSYVMRMFRTRYDELIKSFEIIAFEHIDSRIIAYLTRKMQDEHSRTINISHHSLANELGTTRVVVSRVLKQLENEKKIQLHRGAIHLL